MKSTCPGQDTRFWQLSDIFEVDCNHCGNSIEFFKDDGYRRCKKCGLRVINPKISIGCAQWCEHAKECLGYDPKLPSGSEGERRLRGEHVSLVDKLVAEMKKEFGDDEKRIKHALMVIEWAEEIMKGEGGSPRVIIAAAALHDIGIKEAERKHGSQSSKYQEIEGPAIAQRIMEELKFDPDTIDHVSRIIANHHSVNGFDTPEFRIIRDADQIVNLYDEHGGFGEKNGSVNIDKVFKTETGKSIAKKLFPEKKEVTGLKTIRSKNSAT